MIRLSYLSLIALPIALSMAPSCKVGDVSERENNAAGSDAAADVIDGGEVAGIDAQAVDDDCELAVTPNNDGNHNPGQSCIVAGCHDGNTQDAPLWTLAGTAYTDINGTTPLAGGTILYTDANNAEIKIITDTNGNFYTAQTILFPIQVAGSRCPNTLPMVAAVADAAMANCNQGGCHGTGDSRIYVPE
tara:strand:+ start:14720 stop:15286 length:567 start_codon:yes stop_codon:yes gene_type:complete